MDDNPIVVGGPSDVAYPELSASFTDSSHSAIVNNDKMARISTASERLSIVCLVVQDFVEKHYVWL